MKSQREMILAYIEEHQELPIIRMGLVLQSIFGVSPKEAGQYMAEWVKQ